MGRGEGHHLGTDANEIRALDADRLDDHRHQSVEADLEGSSDYGDAGDTRAINHLITKLKHTTSGSKLSSEDLEDRAISLYQGMLQKMEQGCSLEDQRKIARALGESVESLRERLGLATDSSLVGESNLLAQLRSIS